MPSKPGKPIMVRCTARMRERLDAVLNKDAGENVSDVVRALLEAEIVRREREAMRLAAEARSLAAQPITDRAPLELRDTPAPKGPSK